MVIWRIKKKESNNETKTKTKKLIPSMKTVSGGAAIKKYAVLNDKRHILTKDTDNNVAIYDVLKVTKVKDLGQVDFDNELKQHNQKVFIPNWFTVDLKTGVCIIQISMDGKVSNMLNKKKNVFLLEFVLHRCRLLFWAPTKWIAFVRGSQLKPVYPNMLKLVQT